MRDHHYFWLVIALVLFLLTGCNNRPSVDFDESGWKEDHAGCEMKRIKIYEDLLKEKDQLLKLNSQRIIEILGKPDRNELYNRNQKFFIYHITPASSCNSYDMGQIPLYLVIRFNALGLSSELYISNERSPTTL